MRSPTQRSLDPGQLAALVRDSLGSEVVDPSELTGGGFAAVWRARLADGRDVVIKIGPPASVPLLEYEVGMVAAEAEYLRLVRARVPSVPTADVLHLGADFVITTLLPGTPLTALADSVDPTQVRRDLGSAIAHVHTVTGERFGYTGGRPHGTTWRAAFGEIIKALLRDASAWGVSVPRERVRAALTRHRAELDRIGRPALLHFDLWDGNILATADSDGVARLTGLVDGERFLYGDPLIDFVSPELGGRIAADHPFVLGYNDVSADPVEFDDSTEIRLGLYRMFLYLLMTVEMPSRAMADAAAQARRQWLHDLLDRQLDDLAA